MLALKIGLILLGILLLILGSSILFMKKYNIINGYKEDERNGVFDDTYARRVGIIEFAGGIVNIIIGVTSLFFSETFIAFGSMIGIFLVLVSLLINQIKSKNK